MTLFSFHPPPNNAGVPLPPPANPPQLVDINNTINHKDELSATEKIAWQLAQANRKLDELPILLSNSRTPIGPLRNPTLVHNGHNGWAQAPYLEPPNPRTQDELSDFTTEQRLASAQNLGLPPLLPGALVQERRRQIAFRLGINVG